MRGSQLFTEERVRAAALVVLGSAIGLAASFVFGLPPSTLGSLGAATGALVSAALSVRGEKDALDADIRRTVAELRRRVRASAKTLDVMCLSAQNVDYFYAVDRIAPDYETFVDKVTRGAGGSGANTVYALAKLGLDTCVIGIVTEDPDGRYLRESFASAGVGMDFLFATGEGSTGRTTILTTGPQRTIIVEPGSNNLLHAHFARQREPIFEALDRTRLLHLTSFAGERERNLQLELIARLPSDALLAFTPGSIQSKQARGAPADLETGEHHVHLRE